MSASIRHPRLTIRLYKLYEPILHLRIKLTYNHVRSSLLRGYFFNSASSSSSIWVLLGSKCEFVLQPPEYSM